MTTDTLPARPTARPVTRLGKGLSADAIKEAYELIEATGKSQDEIVKALSGVLHSIGYDLADNVGSIITTHLKARKQRNHVPATLESAGAIARKLYTAATGNELPEPTPAETAEPRDAAANATSENSAPASETELSGDPIEISPAPPSENTTYMAAVIKIDPSEEDLAGINPLIKNASTSVVKSLAEILHTLQTLHTTIEAQRACRQTLEQKIALFKAERNDEAQAIAEAKLPIYKSTKLGEVTFDPALLPALNTMLKQITPEDVINGPGAPGITDLTDLIATGEKEIGEEDKALRQLQREARRLAPRRTAAKGEARAASSGATSEADDWDYEVVYRPASEIFDEAFGENAGILDFDVPTIEWHSDQPSVVPEIDPSFAFYGKVLAFTLFCIAKGKLPWIYGETGCGKSVFVEQVAARLGYPFIRVNMDSHVTRSDLIGLNRLGANHDGATIMRFHDGIVPRALSMPSILLFDEIDCGDPEIMPILQPVLEGRGVRILEDSGRQIDAHSLCRMIATGNTVGLGSENQAYLNTHVQSAATRDRVAMYIKMPYLPEAMEIQVVLQRIPDADPDFVKSLVQLANETRKGYETGKLQQLISTRHVQDAAEAHATFAPLWDDPVTARDEVLQVTVLNFMDEASGHTVRELIDQIFV